MTSKKKKPVATAGSDKTPARPSAVSGADAQNLAYIRELAAVVDEFGLSRIKVVKDKVTLLVEKQSLVAAPAMVAAAPSVHPAAAPAHDDAGNESGKNGAGQDQDAGYVTVHSPFVGTFYRGPSPGKPAFVEVGQQVSKGQVMCIVEAMKLMNEIEAEMSGTVVAILVDNESAVEYNQPLFKLAPN